MRTARLAFLAVVGLLPAVMTCGDSTAPKVPAAISRADGDGQSAGVGQALSRSLVVKVVDAAGSAVKGVAVAWTVAGGGGTVNPGSGTTDAQGLASTTWTLGLGIGTNAVTARVASNAAIASVSFYATAQPGPAAKMAFIAQPSAVAGGVISPAVQVLVQDALGNTVTSATTSITMAITSGTGTSGAVLGGTPIRAAVGGVATFVDLTVDRAGTGYTLTATATNLTSATSTAWDLAAACEYASSTSVTVGQTVNGTLAAGDCRVSSTYIDLYTLTLASATNIQVELTGSPLDTYLSLINRATNAFVAANDNDALTGVGNRNSRVNIPLAAGTYSIQATSVATGATGAYKLRVCNSAPSTIALGQTLSGTLATTDCGLAATGDGTLIDRWWFTLALPTIVTLTQTSAAFDAFLYLLNSAETSVLAGDDDGAGGNDARIVTAGTSVLQPGTYSVWTSAYDPGATGDYQLSLTGAVDYCSVSNPISNPQTVAGDLAAADCRLSDASYADRWKITLAAPTALRIDMTSAAFDAFLFMRDVFGNTVASDDDAGGATNARIEGTFPAGTYIIWANSFLPAVTGAYGLAVSTAPAGAVNLHIDRLYLVQSTQDFNGSVPLVRGRDALVRVFVRADQTNSAFPTVRVRTYLGGVLQTTRTIPAPGASVPTVLNEGSLTSSWNVLIPAAEIQPGLQILADVDPTNAIAEGNEGDNSYPANGVPAALDVRTMPTLYLTLVPVVQSANGLTGNVTVGNQDSFLNLTRRMWPFSTVDPVIHAPYTTTTPGALASSGTNWSPVLAELLALRTAEGSSRHYYGVVKVSYNSGVAGLGYIGLPAAMGWDYLPTGDGVIAHELGHNFNRLHTPCGGPSGPDPYYPYAGGVIGVYGYDAQGDSVKARTMPDLMSYCHPEWISDYTYRGALDYIVAHPTSPTIVSGPVASVLLWGRIDDGQLVLEPAIEVTAVPTPLPPSGPYRLQGTDASGRTILNLSFAPDDVADAPTPSQHFAFVIPKSTLRGGALSALQLSGPAGASASLRSSGAADNAALIDAAATATRRAAGLVEVRWDAARYPLAVIRSTVTGEILSFARGGVVSVPDAGAEIEVIVSDGVRSATRRLVPR